MPRWAPRLLALAALLAATRAAAAPAGPTAHEAVDGAEVSLVAIGASRADADARRVAWSTLSTTDVPPGPRWLLVDVPRGAEALSVPVCAGRKRVWLDGVDAHAQPGPVVVDVPRDGGAHRLAIELDVGGYEHRVACGDVVRAGTRVSQADGLVRISFASAHGEAGGGQAVMFVPPGHDMTRPASVLVGLHPWSGGMWTYAAYAELLSAARARDLVLLFPSGLGNSLYTAAAEDEVLRALAELCRRLPVDPDRVTLWGASMGGAGATTIGFHHPDLFAGIVSLFGDAKYDLSTYVRGILRDGAGAHLVNALDIVENVRNVPVWLIHGESDHVSPIAQSAMLARALEAMRFTVTFDRVAGAGHEGRVVAAFADRVVAFAAAARRVAAPTRVSFWSVRPGDLEAYGIRLVKRAPRADAFFDVGRGADGSVRLIAARNVRALSLPRGAFGLPPSATPEVLRDQATADVDVTWDHLP